MPGTGSRVLTNDLMVPLAPLTVVVLTNRRDERRRPWRDIGLWSYRYIGVERSKASPLLASQRTASEAKAGDLTILSTRWWSALARRTALRYGPVQLWWPGTDEFSVGTWQAKGTNRQQLCGHSLSYFGRRASLAW